MESDYQHLWLPEYHLYLYLVRKSPSKLQQINQSIVIIIETRISNIFKRDNNQVPILLTDQHQIWWNSIDLPMSLLCVHHQLSSILFPERNSHNCWLQKISTWVPPFEECWNSIFSHFCGFVATSFPWYPQTYSYCYSMMCWMNFLVKKIKHKGIRNQHCYIVFLVLVFSLNRKI